MQENAGPAWAENHFHVACRCGHGVELEDSLTGGFAGKVLWGFVAFKEAQLDPAASTGAAAGVFRSVFGDDVAVQAGKRLGIVGEGAVRGGNKDVAKLVVVTGAHLHDAWIVVTGGAGGARAQ